MKKDGNKEKNYFKDFQPSGKVVDSITKISPSSDSFPHFVFSIDLKHKEFKAAKNSVQKLLSMTQNFRDKRTTNKAATRYYLDKY